MTFWAQYNLSDLMPAPIQATNSVKVDDEILKAQGRGQVEIPPGLEASVSVDVSVDPPAFF